VWEVARRALNGGLLRSLFGQQQRQWELRASSAEYAPGIDRASRFSTSQLAAMTRRDGVAGGLTVEALFPSCLRPLRAGLSEEDRPCLSPSAQRTVMSTISAATHSIVTRSGRAAAAQRRMGRAPRALFHCEFTLERGSRALYNKLKEHPVSDL